MVRQGVLAFLILGLAACTQDVDDPANFTAGNSQGNSSGNTTTGGSPDTDSATSISSQGNSATTSGASADSTGAATTISGSSGDPLPGMCGNGVVDAGEQCDGLDLQNFTCDSLGLSGNGLACDDTMCTFDTSMCMAGGGTSG